MNSMKAIRLEKVTLNMGAGDSVQRAEASKKVLELLAGKKVVFTVTRKRTTFGLAKGRNIGAKVVLRKKEGEEALKRMMAAAENRVNPSSFDNQGNFSFGVKEYIHIPGAQYDPEIGILGLDVAVTLERPGFRVKRKKIKRGKIGNSHLIKKEDAIEWATAFGFTVKEKEEETF